MGELEQIMQEMYDVAKSYNSAEQDHIKEHYDAYVRIIILNQLPRDYQESCLEAWEKMKG